MQKEMEHSVLERLREHLLERGGCSLSVSSCPIAIEYKIAEVARSEGAVPPWHDHVTEWRCNDCVEMFIDICDLREEADRRDGVNAYKPCPCFYLPDTSVALPRVEERISELEKLLPSK